jgi:hypothetical protein
LLVGGLTEVTRPLGAFAAVQVTPEKDVPMKTITSSLFIALPILLAGCSSPSGEDNQAAESDVTASASAISQPAAPFVGGVTLDWEKTGAGKLAKADGVGTYGRELSETDVFDVTPIKVSLHFFHRGSEHPSLRLLNNYPDTKEQEWPVALTDERAAPQSLRFSPPVRGVGTYAFTTHLLGPDFHDADVSTATTPCTYVVRAYDSHEKLLGQTSRDVTRINYATVTDWQNMKFEGEAAQFVGAVHPSPVIARIEVESKCVVEPASAPRTMPIALGNLSIEP